MPRRSCASPLGISIVCILIVKERLQAFCECLCPRFQLVSSASALHMRWCWQNEVLPSGRRALWPHQLSDLGRYTSNTRTAQFHRRYTFSGPHVKNAARYVIADYRQQSFINGLRIEHTTTWKTLQRYFTSRILTGLQTKEC